MSSTNEKFTGKNEKAEKKDAQNNRKTERSGVMNAVAKGLKIAAVTGTALWGAKKLGEKIDPKRTEAITEGVKKGLKSSAEAVKDKAGDAWKGTKDMAGTAVEKSKEALHAGKNKAADLVESAADRMDRKAKKMEE